MSRPERAADEPGDANRKDFSDREADEKRRWVEASRRGIGGAGLAW
jgi:hypothetical protein